MFDQLEKYIVQPMMRFSQLKFVRAITAAGISTTAFTIVGSMFLVFSVLPQVFPVLVPLWAATFDRVQPLYLIAYNASIGVIALYFLIVTTYEYASIIADEDELDLSPVTAVGMAIFCVFMLMVEFVYQDSSFAVVNDPAAGVLNGYRSASGGLADLAASGIFTSFAIAFFVVNVYKQCVKRDITIHMPGTVPPGVTRAFAALIPNTIIAFTCMVVDGVLAVAGTNIYALVGIPFGFVVNIVNTLPGLLVIYLLVHLLWLFGIHGANIISSWLTAISVANMATNLTGETCAVYAGEIQNAFITLGGSGCTLGLCLLMCFCAKSEQLKILGRSALIPGLFNINEPLLFGLPFVFNPRMAVPFILAPLAATVITYVGIDSGIVSPIIASMPWPTPPGLGAFISCGGDYKAAVLALINLGVATAIYLPFFKAYDARLAAEEAAATAGEKPGPSA